MRANAAVDCAALLLELHGIVPSGAARLLGDIGDVARFPTRAHFASWNGTAPIDASSGEQNRHRLSRDEGDDRLQPLHQPQPDPDHDQEADYAEDARSLVEDLPHRGQVAPNEHLGERACRPREQR